MKWIAWVCVFAVLLMPVGALAQQLEMTTYTNPDIGYKIDYPADWRAVDSENIEQILQDAIDGKIQGMDASLLENSKESLSDGGAALFIAPGNELNVNVIYQDIGVHLTAPQMVEALCPSMVEQFQSMFPDVQILTPGDLMTSGDVEYAYVFIQCTTNGEQTVLSQTYTMAGNILYIITYTLFPERGLDMDVVDQISTAIAGSFVAPQA